MEPSLVPTRHSLLCRLKNLADEEIWKEFFETYWRLIYAAGLRSGLRVEDAEDVVQDTVLAVAKSIGSYRYDPKVTFKGWLRMLVRRRIADHFRRKRGRELLLEDVAGGDADGKSAMDQATAQETSVLDLIWDEEWERNLVEAALEKVKDKVSVKQYQVFYLHVIKEKPVREVGKALNVSAPYIHLTRHRVGRIFREAVRRVERSEAR